MSSQSRSVEILFGAPGTGKTTSLIKEVEKALLSGIPPDRIAYLAFTRKAAHEAIDRACDPDGELAQFKLSKSDFPWFRTLHSAAYRLLDLKKSDVMTTSHFRELGDDLGLVFNGTYDYKTERVPIDVTGNGDRCLSIYAKSKAKQISLEDAWYEARFYDLPFHIVQKFARNLDAFKESRALVDFTDMIDMCQQALDVDVFIGDEAQDFTRQQWSLAKRLGHNAQKVFLGGDDDQAIYGWSGATHLPLLTLKGERRILPTSYRLPRSIKQLADRISGRIKSRQSKVFGNRDADGSVRWVREPEFVDLAKGRWLLLARNRYHLSRLESVARNQFVVYHSTDGWSNSTPSIRAVVSFERLRRGEAISPTEFRSLSRYVPGRPECNVPDKVRWSDIPWKEGITNHHDWMEVLELAPGEREYIRGLRRRGEPLTSPGRVTISTVHGAKGGEAENVLLMTDITRKVAEGAEKDPDSENRVLYVGVSRAKENLFLCQPLGRNYWRV